MKAKIISSLILLVFICAGCGHKVEKMEEGFIPPAVLKQPRLLYPKIAQEKAIEGNTTVIISITKTGKVDNVYIIKSSGYKILDSAAVEYCKSIVFSPAKRNGIPVNSRIEWELKFNISDQNWEVDNYLQEIANLYRKILLIGTSNNVEKNYRIEIEREILNKHNEFVQNYGDALNFNFILKQVILPEISKEWQNYWDGWPLSFLLYHDFIKRFQDYDSLPKVRTLLINSLKLDIQYIKNTPAYDIKTQREKDKILNKIKLFISSNYPDIILKELGLDAKINSMLLTKSTYIDFLQNNSAKY